jgi:Zn finger protein HypA/HybF involved in hydrogenase expression
MHDLHLANQIVKIAQKKANGEKIKSISLELGDILEHGENITPKNLKYNINLLLPAAEVMIKKITGNSWKLKEIETE